MIPNIPKVSVEKNTINGYKIRFNKPTGKDILLLQSLKKDEEVKDEAKAFEDMAEMYAVFIAEIELEGKYFPINKEVLEALPIEDTHDIMSLIMGSDKKKEK